jgi:hypothetical protein
MEKINGSRWWLHIYKFSYLHFIVLHIYIAPEIVQAEERFYAIAPKSLSLSFFLFPSSRRR